MYNVRPNLVVGFHGCDEHVRDTLLNHPDKIGISREKHDWLGYGMYFWENNYDRAVEWANEKHLRGTIKKPAVIGAVLDLGYCCDFLGTKHLRMLKNSFEAINKSHEGKKLPKNKDRSGDTNGDKVIRMLDCHLIEYMFDNLKEQIEKDHTIQGYSEDSIPDSVRGAFIEGAPVFPESGIYEKTHIQISIRNPDCIKGFFIPGRKRHTKGLYDDLIPGTEEGNMVSDRFGAYGIRIQDQSGADY